MGTSLSGTGIAANQNNQTGKPSAEVLRQNKTLQKLRQISKDDNASTTGLLVNPPAAIIPNSIGAGGQAGSQGLFGANLGAGQTDIPQRRSHGADASRAPVENPLVTLLNIYSDPQTYADQFNTPTGSARNHRPPGNPMPARNIFAGVQTGAGVSAGSPFQTPTTNGFTTPNGFVNAYGAFDTFLNDAIQGNRPNAYPAYANSVNARQDAAHQQYIQGEKNYAPISAPILARLTKEQEAASQSNTSIGDFPGTAGLYTYGQFSDKDAAFVQMMAAGLPTDIPAAVADNLGLTGSLSSPDSGWKFDPQTNMWRAPAEIVNPQGTTPISNNNTNFNQTGFYQDYLANNTPFEEQLRWDGNKYVRVGDWMNKYKNPSRAAKLAQKRRQQRKVGYGEVQDTYGSGSSSSDSYDPSGFTGSWGVVTFNTGSG